MDNSFKRLVTDTRITDTEVVTSDVFNLHQFTDASYRLARVVYTNTTGQGILQISGIAKG